MTYITEHPSDVKYLYVYEISRLGRTTLETINLISKLEKMGIMVWSLSPNEAFTRSNEQSIRQLLIMIFSWVAQRERDNLIDRTKAGLDRARAEGKILGRERCAIDFEVVKKMRADKASWEKIAETIGITNMTLYRARKRRGLL